MNVSVVYHPELDSFSEQLSRTISGTSDFSAASVAMYTSDASNYRQIPLGVVYPRNSEDIKITVRLCQQHGYAVLMRGGGTSQNGQCVNNAVVIDCSRFMTRVLEINQKKRTALVEPGVVCDALKASAQEYGLTFGPDPATHSRCTLGGMIGNNSCGPHSMVAGKTVENILELEVLTSDGHSFWVGPTTDEAFVDIIKAGGRRAEIYTRLKLLVDQHADEIRQKYPTIKRRVSGYNLDQLLPENNFNVARALVGTEGTCVSILQAKVRLIENPKHVHLVVLGFKDIFSAGDVVPHILPYSPIAMEGIDWNIVGGLNDRNLRQHEISLLPAGRAWLLVELAASTPTTVQTSVDRFVTAMQNDDLVNSVLQVTNPADVKALWSIREQGASATSLALNPDNINPVVGWEDTAVDPLQLGHYLRALYELVDRYGYKTSLYGHFGDGCIHARMTFDTRTKAGVHKWREFSQEIAKLVVQFGGSLSGEHGDGQAKAEFLPIMFGETLVKAFKEFKTIWDPARHMNPRKIVDPYRMDENLRYGPDYHTPIITSALHFAEDAQGFGRASERCIGMGKCRSASGAMCPSYQATGEERYSTRGRAHLLHELVRGDVIQDGWGNTDIADSLQHCLSCKACKSSCPTKVDIAAYKAEFMHNHYAGKKRRPLYHYVFGFVGNWLPLAARFSTIFNFVLRSRLGNVIRTLLSIEKDKKMPLIAAQIFASWAKKNATHEDEHFYWHGNANHASVVLWADSFNAHYSPHLLQSAVNVLTQSRFRVAIAKAHFCCGRPLYEFGFLKQAKKQLHIIFEQFCPNLPDQTPVIVIEPSCLSVFKDEIMKLYPNDEAAIDLAARALSLAQFLQRHNVNPARKLPVALVHTHCHEKSLHTDAADATLMRSCFESVIEPEPGCCGMAGSFGLHEKTHQIGSTLFQANLRPAIDQCHTDTFIVSNGFSCRSQITDSTHKSVYHFVEIMEKCL